MWTTAMKKEIYISQQTMDLIRLKIHLIDNYMDKCMDDMQQNIRKLINQLEKISRKIEWVHKQVRKVDNYKNLKVIKTKVRENRNKQYEVMKRRKLTI